MKKSCPTLTDQEAKAYNAPFVDQTYKAGVRAFPNLVCDHPEANGAELSRKAKQFWMNEWQGKSFMAIGMQDPVIPPVSMEKLRSLIKNCPSPLKLDQAGHFVQEHGEMVAKEALKSFASS